MKEHAKYLETTLVASFIVILAIVPSIAAETNPLGETIWPPDGQTDQRSVVDIGAQVLNTSDPLVLGLERIDAFDITRVNETTSRLELRTANRTHTVTQSHEAVAEGDSGGFRQIGIRPPQLTPTVELAPSPGSRFLLQVVGSPGSFGVDGDDIREKATSFARQVDLPQDRNHTDDTGWELERPLDRHLMVRLYQGMDGCSQRSDGNCTQKANFIVECLNCTELVRTFPPSVEREVGFLTNRSVQAGGDEVRLLFDPGGHLIAARVSLVFDVDVSGILDPDQAFDQVQQALEDRGYTLVRGSGGGYDRASGFPPSPTVGFRLTSSGDDVEPSGAQYLWAPDVTRNGTQGEADVVQDAVSGEVLDVEVDSGPIREDPGSPAETPALGLAVVLLVGALAAAVAGRRRWG